MGFDEGIFEEAFFQRDLLHTQPRPFPKQVIRREKQGKESSMLPGAWLFGMIQTPTRGFSSGSVACSSIRPAGSARFGASV